MDWKSPPLLLGGLNSAGLLGLFFWSYKKFGALESEFAEIKAAQKELYEKVGGQDGKLFDRVQQSANGALSNIPIIYNETDETQDELNNVIENTADLRKFLVDFLTLISSVESLTPEEKDKLKNLVKKLPKKPKEFKKSNARKERERRIEIAERANGNARSSRRDKKKKKNKKKNEKEDKKKKGKKNEKEDKKKKAKKKEESSDDDSDDSSSDSDSSDSSNSSSESGMSEEEMLLRPVKK